jgi:hypothetical protein
MVVLTTIIVSCSWYFGYARWWALGQTTIYCCDPISFDSRFIPSVTLTWRCGAIMEAECGSQSSKVNISKYIKLQFLMHSGILVCGSSLLQCKILSCFCA